VKSLLRASRPTLALRLSATFALGALLVSAAVALSAYVFTQSLDQHSQERSASHQTYVNAAAVRARLRDPHANLPAILGELTAGSTSQTVIYVNGRWFSSSLVISRDSIPADVRADVARGSPTLAWTRAAGAPRIVVGVPLPAVRAEYFQVFNETPLQHTLAILRTVLVAAAAAATAAGAGIGWWASRRLTAPLRSVSTAAREVAAGSFDTRLATERDGELAGLVDSFNAMVAALSERVERDARFAADVSHELRSPLTTLSTSLSVLQARRGDMSDRGRAALDLVAAEISRLQRLVEDLLEISRPATGTIEDAEPVQLWQLVSNVLEAPEYAGVTARFDGDAAQATVRADKRRLEQVLRNLLDNASRYAGGATSVRGQCAGGTVTVYVDDRGPGVPEDERERIYERFGRGRNAARRGAAAGTGLGLALVREHVRAHGGRTWVTDAPEGGARFVVQLPVELP
jgi:two-component system, OmpR family, sensor histidine kinase MtrB